eukprot:GHVL01045023.1.p1 GENE.GHVL01045023.1~~GHVL01045023.1.p1  ORF type:complete len:549 (+),score=112.21 GHVL01045023.1:52-1698(+)
MNFNLIYFIYISHSFIFFCYSFSQIKLLNNHLQPLVNVTIGDENLILIADVSFEGLLLMSKNSDFCKKNKISCFDDEKAGLKNEFCTCSNHPICLEGYQDVCSNCTYTQDIKKDYDVDMMFDASVYRLSLVEGNVNCSLNGLTVSESPVKLGVELATPKKPILFGHDQISPVGFLGLAGKEFSCRDHSSLFEEYMLSKNASLFALDFGGSPDKWIYNQGGSIGEKYDKGGSIGEIYDKGGSIDIGDIQNIYKNDTIIWSLKRPSFDDYNNGLYWLFIFNLKICKANVLQTDTSNWISVLDSGSACLGLPSWLYQRIVNSWISPHALMCPTYKDATKVHEQPGEDSLCRVKDGYLGKLPVITFELEEHDIEENTQETLELRLDDLVYYNDKKEAILCVAELPPVRSKSGRDEVLEAGVDPLRERIVFGSLVIRSFYTIIDKNKNKVGLIQKQNNALKDNKNVLETCRERMKCVGAQKYAENRNVCDDPPCSDWKFKKVDPITKQCIYAPWAITTGIILVAFVVVADICAHGFSLYLTMKARTAAVHAVM